ncbi:hypothetical protein D9M72_643490 [compost metagenome]
MPPATAELPPDDALCTEAAAAIASAEPVEAAMAAICAAADAAALSPPLWVVTSISRISLTVANWLTVRTR